MSFLFWTKVKITSRDNFIMGNGTCMVSIKQAHKGSG